MSVQSLAHLGLDSQVSGYNVAAAPAVSRPRGYSSVHDGGWWPGLMVREQCALYTRVLAGGADAESQLAELRHYVRGRGWEVGREYLDWSGVADGAGLSALMRDARRKRFDLIVVSRLSRFASSFGQLTRALAELEELGIDFVSFQDGVETLGPCGARVRGLFSALARLRRDLRSQRVATGAARSGRPGARLDYQRLVQLRSQGLSHRAIARLFGVSHSTIGRRLKRGW